ncbi:flagellar biosynthesis protein FlhF [Nitrospira sp. BLG_2]|uniref:flagellar biosynthesis protein FlhF n=1 Tax=Nitrospira sp. BLG_2 TaxID=3397507 RepID=UPI003B9A66B7
MKVKTFHALSMQDAMRAIKDELGPDAIILSAKEVREGGRIVQAFNRPVLEVMAASDQDVRIPQRGEAVQPAVPVKPSDAEADSTLSAQTFQQTLQGMLKPNCETPTSTAGQRSASLKPSAMHVKPDRLRPAHAVVNELKSLLEDLSRADGRMIGSRTPSAPVWLRRSLIEQGMNPSTVDLLVSEAFNTEQVAGPWDDESMRRALRREIEKRVRTSGPLPKGKGYPAICLLIGPSGAGKTSAVAKLASHYRLEQRRSVALITFDTYRETAIEQVRRYAKVVGVPFACAVSARQVHEGLRRHTRVDLVLIDMPGIGPRDLALAEELRQLLPREVVTTHLVLSASTREQELYRLTKRLGDLPQLRLLFTKLDETQSFGTIFEVAHQTGVPLSYWSIGRRVPGDIEVASSERLAAFLTAERSAYPQTLVNRLDRSSEATPALMGAGTHHG